MENSKPPYDERSDDQKLESNWHKASKLYERKDWSACIVRIATSVEIAANIHIRAFFRNECQVPSSVVDALLKAANGIDGKFGRLIKPISEHRGTWGEIKALKSEIDKLNDHRNSIAHSGAFKSAADAWACFQIGLSVIQKIAPSEVEKLELPEEG